MKYSLLVVIVGAMLAGCGGAETQSIANEQVSKEALATGSTTCNTGSDSWSNLTIETNLSVPAGATFRLSGVKVMGNVSVAGDLLANGVTFYKNVSVDGGSLQVGSWGATFRGNLSINNSPGSQVAGGAVQDGFWTAYADTYVCRNFSYSYDLTYTGPKYAFYIQNGDGQGNSHNVFVVGSFTVSNSPAPNGDAPVMVNGGPLPASCTN